MGFLGLQSPQMRQVPTYNMQYYYTAWCVNALIYIAMSMVVVVVSSEQVVKPHSRQAGVKPVVLHLFECLLLVHYSVESVVFIKWVWLEKFSLALCVHYCHNPTFLKILDPPLDIISSLKMSMMYSGTPINNPIPKLVLKKSARMMKPPSTEHQHQ